MHGCTGTLAGAYQRPTTRRLSIHRADINIARHQLEQMEALTERKIAACIDTGATSLTLLVGQLRSILTALRRSCTYQLRLGNQ
jgi:hypothetical protein